MKMPRRHRHRKLRSLPGAGRRGLGTGVVARFLAGAFERAGPFLAVPFERVDELRAV